MAYVVLCYLHKKAPPWLLERVLNKPLLSGALKLKSLKVVYGMGDKLYSRCSLIFFVVTVCNYNSLQVIPISVLINTCQTINSRRILLVGYWWLVTGASATEGWLYLLDENLPSHSQIGVAIFASFRQEKPWRSVTTPSPIFLIVSLSMRH